MSGWQGEQQTWAKLSAIKANCGIEVCLDECLKKLEAEDKAARKAEAQKRQQAGLKPSRAAEEGAAAVGPEAAEGSDDNAPLTTEGHDSRASMGESAGCAHAFASVEEICSASLAKPAE